MFIPESALSTKYFDLGDNPKGSPGQDEILVGYKANSICLTKFLLLFCTWAILVILVGKVKIQCILCIPFEIFYLNNI